MTLTEFFFFLPILLWLKYHQRQKTSSQIIVLCLVSTLFFKEVKRLFNESQKACLSIWNLLFQVANKEFVLGIALWICYGENVLSFVFIWWAISKIHAYNQYSDLQMDFAINNYITILIIKSTPVTWDCSDWVCFPFAGNDLIWPFQTNPKLFIVLIIPPKASLHLQWSPVKKSTNGSNRKLFSSHIRKIIRHKNSNSEATP